MLHKRLLITWVFLSGFTGSLPAQDPPDAAQLQSAASALRQASRLLSEKKYESAAERAREAVDGISDQPALLQRAAEILYCSGYSRESVPLFDRVVELAPESAAHNWQRGIALCSQARWKQGARQFKTHHDVNPDDVENSAWYFLCVAKQQGLEAARKTVIPSRGDGRQPMMSVLEMLQGRLKPEEVAEAAIRNTREGRPRKTAQFYADLYIGLYYDAVNDAEQAQKYLRRSLTYDVNGYMADTARVYLKDRFPTK